jgi:heptosyltransferase-2
LVYNEKTAQQLSNCHFDEVVCFEKSASICQFAGVIDADRRLGFGWNGSGIYVHPLSQSVADIANGKDHFLPIQALLYQMVGDYWRGEDYVLGYKPRSRQAFDVGLNCHVGSKWPTKAWPVDNWLRLEALLGRAGFSVTWQEGRSDLDEYMDWINACRTVVTCDSLGMHLGLAMKKKVVALFGPTPSFGIYMYGRGEILRSSGSCGRAPCMQSACDCGTKCMGDISAELVFKMASQLVAVARESEDPNEGSTCRHEVARVSEDGSVHAG